MTTTVGDVIDRLDAPFLAYCPVGRNAERMPIFGPCPSDRRWSI